jgi:hypothetical protein
MRTNRRKFIGTALAGGLAATWPVSGESSETKRAKYARLDEILKKPVLKKGLLPSPLSLRASNCYVISAGSCAECVLRMGRKVFRLLTAG